MALPPQQSIPIALATATMVYALHSNATPTLADIRTARPLDPDIDSARKSATWTGAALVSAISLVARDPSIFVIGGITVVAMDLMTRHADVVNPAAGRPTLRDRLLPVDNTSTQESAPADYGYAGAMENVYVMG